MRSYWNKRRVLVTGFEGFLGSHLSKTLLSYGSYLVGLDIVTGRKETLLEKNDYNKLKVIKGSVANFKLIKDIISGYKINTIFHLAAESQVQRSIRDPLRTFSSNIRGTWNILEASKRLGAVVEAIIIASSDKAYGSHNKLPYTEETALRGNHPYDVSKSCADLIAQAYHNTFGSPVVITRCGNIYGPGDFNFARLIPDCIKCALKGKRLFIRSDGKLSRDYVYVQDIVDGYILLAEKLNKLGLAGQAFNLSNNNHFTVIQVVRKIFELVAEEPNYKILNAARYEIKHQYLSSDKARTILGWRPRFDLESGLKNTITWYKENFTQYEN